MLKHTILALTFVAALGVSGLGISSTANAHGGWYRGGFHGPHVSYRMHGYGPRYHGYYGPRSYGYYGPAYYPSYYGGYGYGGAYIPLGGHHRFHRGGVYVGIGF